MLHALGNKHPAHSSASISETARVLIVDDNPEVSASLASLIDEYGYQGEVAHNGRSALRRIAQNPPDLILLDLQLPDVDGLYICDDVKNNKLTRLIPIIIVTACGDRDAQLRSIEAGAEGYLQKPIDTQELKMRLRTLLRVKRLNEMLEPAENVIFTLARAVEAKDPYTESHLQRLAHYATAIGERLGLDDIALTELRYGAILHDVGKVGIDETIIRKTGPLSPDEYRVMQQHTLIGERIVAPLRIAAHVGPIIRSHHERWDGYGYPDGLSGTAIPLGARIVSVVDAFDAMTTQRPYNRVRSHSEALSQLWAEAGTAWDPQIVTIFAEWLLEQKLVPMLEHSQGV
ncbi:MAG: response regulator [Chloroflexales bacterium]|nr:response regulator [Chloroflexales bacterium]